ncbi:MAG: threonine/serine dehydratase [Candidatus Dormibacteraeota bacterium]|nr:threonine/serine dehydratase [Candidatus Dormibacteraeota bacterium]
MMVDLDFAREHLPSIRKAAERIFPHVRRTPALTTDLDPTLVFKPECFQVTGSFKARGAFNAVLSLPAGTAGVVTASSGNHAQAVALAARTAGLPALILIPEGANPAKVAATRGYGARVISAGITFANRDEKLIEAVRDSGYALVHPYDDWDVIHGQGTAALELMGDHPDVELIACPVGGGGQIAGWALAIKALNPDVKIIGVEPEAADDAYRSFQSRTLQRLDGPPVTMADGVKTLSIGRRNFEVLIERGLLDGMVTVTEEELGQAVVTAWTRCKLALEPTGALTLAAFLAAKLGGSGRKGLVLSGGNADPALIARLLNG